MAEGRIDALAVVGIDHHRSPLALRERLALGQDDLAGVLAGLRTLPEVGEAVVLSTCNRTECYLAAGADTEQPLAWLAERQGVDEDEFRRHAYRLRGAAGVEHLFRVAASLESMVLGEYQIVHQVKTAYEAARGAGATGPVLDPLFQRALALAGSVRSQTRIGANKVSVASVGVDLARQIHGDLGGARLLVIGAGEIAELAVTHLVEAGVGRLSLINRTRERALELAAGAATRVETTVLRWADLGPALAEHDIVVTSTAASRPVVTVDDVRRVRRRRSSPQMYIDLAVPRDVDPAVGGFADVFLFNLDHLDRVVAENLEERAGEAAVAGGLVTAAVDDYCRCADLDQAGLPQRISDFCTGLVEGEGAWLEGRLEGPAADTARQALHRLAGKVQYRLQAWLREHAADPAVHRLLADLVEERNRSS